MFTRVSTPQVRWFTRLSASLFGAPRRRAIASPLWEKGWISCEVVGGKTNKMRIGGTRTRGRSIFRSLPRARLCLLPSPTLDCASLPSYPPASHLLSLRRHDPPASSSAAFLAATARTRACYARVCPKKKMYPGDPPTSSRFQLPFGFRGRGLNLYFRDYLRCFLKFPASRLSNSFRGPFRIARISEGKKVEFAIRVGETAE